MGIRTIETTHGDTSSERVLVMGHDARTVVAIARSLGRRGIEVHVAAAPSESLIQASRYVVCNHRIDLDLSSERGVDAIRRLHSQHNFSLLIPATELIASYLHRFRGRLDDLPVLLTNVDAIEIGLSKSLFHALAPTVGVSVPRTEIAEDASELDRVAASVGFPLFVKPDTSCVSNDPSEKAFVRRAETADELESIRRDAPSGPLVVQEEFSGIGVGVEFLAEHGEVLFAFQHRRLHETRGHGSTYRRSESLDKSLLEAAKSIISAVNYHGVGMCEFKVNPVTGEWRMLEVNPRFWGSLPLAVAAGADFPWLAYRWFVGREKIFRTTYRVGVRCRSFREDLRWTFKSLPFKFSTKTDDASGWAPNRIPTRSLIVDCWRWLAGLDYVDSFAWDDMGPFWFELRKTGGSLLGKLKVFGKIQGSGITSRQEVTLTENRGA